MALRWRPLYTGPNQSHRLLFQPGPRYSGIRQDWVSFFIVLLFCLANVGNPCDPSVPIVGHCSYPLYSHHHSFFRLKIDSQQRWWQIFFRQVCIKGGTVWGSKRQCAQPRSLSLSTKMPANTPPAATEYSQASECDSTCCNWIFPGIVCSAPVEVQPKPSETHTISSSVKKGRYSRLHACVFLRYLVVPSSFPLRPLEQKRTTHYLLK